MEKNEPPQPDHLPEAVYCDHCFTALGKHEHRVTRENEVYHEQCWLVKQRRERMTLLGKL